MAANTLSAIVPEIWGKEVLVARNAAQVLAPTVMAPAESEFEEGDTIHFPVTYKHTVGNVLQDNTENSPAVRNATVVDLLIDKHRGVFAFYGKKELKQIAKNIGFEQQEQRQMGIDLMEDLETQLYNIMIAGAGSQLGVQGGGLTKALLLDVVAAFDAAKTPANDRWLAVPVAGKQDLLSIDQFVKINEGGDRAKALTSLSQVGENFVGQFFGINVIWTTIIGVNGDSPAGYSAVAYHTGSVGLAIQQDVEVDVQERALKVGTDVAATALYGAKVLRSADVFEVLI